jgi:thymidylate kinase
MKKSTRAPLLAICGIDGAGKSSLLKRFEGENLRNGNIIYCRKTNHENSSMISEAVEQPKSGGNDFHNSVYSKLNSIACALDFMSHFNSVIYPHLDGRRWLICDRYKLCYQAYGHTVPGTKHQINRLFAGIPEPDAVIYVHSDPLRCLQRLALKKPPEHERISVLRAFAAAYERLLKGIPNVHYIENSGSIDDAYIKFKNVIDSLLSEKAMKGRKKKHACN